MRKVFTIGMVTVFASFVGLVTYLYVTFNSLLSGDVQLAAPPSLITQLDIPRLEQALERMKRRQNLPYPPESLPNPFDQLQ
jgi:hypothetical protein